MNVLVAAWVGSTNLGDELIFKVLRQRLRDLGATVTVLSVDPKTTASDHGVEAIAARRPFEGIGGMRRVDRMVFGGGGLIQNETSPWNLPFHLSRVVGASAVGLSYAGYALGANGLRGRSARALVRSTMRSPLALSVRDSGSYETMRGLGYDQTILAADPVFSMTPGGVQPQDRIAVALRPSVRRSVLPVQWQRTPSEQPDPWLDAMASSLDQASAHTGLPVHFVAMQRNRDDAVARQVAERMQSQPTFATPTVEEVVTEISNSRAVVAMRYHAAVLAAVAGRPFVSIGYSPKVVELAADLSAGSANVANRPEELPQISARLNNVIGKGEALMEQVAAVRVRETRNASILETLLEIE